MSNANPFVPKGRQPKFRVVITIHDLLNIPLNSGFVYVRWHVKDSGHSESKGRTHNAVVKDYRSVWNVDVDSKVRMMVDKNGNLQESLVVVQVFQVGMQWGNGC
ncbi:hypothetical protein NEOLI_002120 [Neolecta irregularis DAH-3]|uniref:C2 NT-type domain-containing protein n=1 Tax=Neolecta irregularis (strain DAH-3) TaxID=1198029 RepID=A0A1U7LU11_NEOID|nr:hypothetical protein NEOLI_002120 [Neolecta irregularis DAH-3]|eukprot:OLL26160.1 hypothetical protein NEOLI_002120 [Neolecta irregularis DAH-3]